MTIRSAKKTRLEQSMHEPIGIDKEGNEINLLDILGSDPEQVLNQVNLKLEVKSLYRAIDLVLTNREKIIIQLRYGLIDGTCKTQREIASMLGISRSYVSRIESRALDKLNTALEKQN